MIAGSTDFIGLNFYTSNIGNILSSIYLIYIYSEISARHFLTNLFFGKFVHFSVQKQKTKICWQIR